MFQGLNQVLQEKFLDPNQVPQETFQGPNLPTPERNPAIKTQI